MQAQVLGAGLGWSDWGSVVLQNSETDSALRHAIIALGAMYEETIRTHDQTTVHRKLLPLAYKQYQRVIQILRTQLQNNMTTSMETKTLACMLLVVFDFLQGDDRAAAAHLFGGIAMLRNYLAENQASETLLDRIMSPWRTSLDRSGTLPTEGSFGARLLLSYGYLDFWAFCWMDSLTALPEVSVLEGLDVKHLPRPGTKVNVSFQKFTPLENRIREFLRAARGRNLRKSHCTYQYSCASYHGVSPDKLSESTLLTCETTQSNDAMNTVVDMKTKLVELLSQWHTDFDLARSTCTDLEEILAAKVVAVNHKKLDIMLSASRADGTANYQASTPAFKGILKLSQMVVEDKSFPSSSRFHISSPFAFVNGIIYPLYVTALNCEDVLVCQEAIDMLSSRHWKEGAWDSFVMGDIARRKLAKTQSQSQAPEAGESP